MGMIYGNARFREEKAAKLVIARRADGTEMDRAVPDAGTTPPGDYSVLADEQEMTLQAHAFDPAKLTGPWRPNTVYAVGDVAFQTNPDADTLVLEVTSVSGSAESGVTEPTWDITAAGTTSDNDLVWETLGTVSEVSPVTQFWYQPFLVTSISPTTGNEAGGTAVTLTGENFDTGASATVDFGTDPATNVVVVSSTEITCDSPAGTGTVDVTVTQGSESDTLAGAFEYTSVLSLASISPTTGDEAGGSAVTITGENFDTGAAATVNFGVNAATGVTVDSATQISATTPANEKPVLMDSAKKGSNITLDATGLIVSNESGIDDLSQAILADTSKSAGKHYAEFVMTEVTAPITAGVGLAPDAFAFSTDWAGKGSSYAHWKSGLFTGGSNVNSKSFATGDVIMVAFDADAGKIWFGKNGTWYDSGDPGAGTGEQFSGVTGAYAITVTPWDDGSIVDVVTESGELSHTIPTGFDPWIKTVAESVDVTVTQGSESGTLAAAFEYVLA